MSKVKRTLLEQLKINADLAKANALMADEILDYLNTIDESLKPLNKRGFFRAIQAAKDSGEFKKGDSSIAYLELQGFRPSDELLAEWATHSADKVED